MASGTERAAMAGNQRGCSLPIVQVSHAPASPRLCRRRSPFNPGFQTVMFTGAVPPGMRSIHPHKWHLCEWIERIPRGTRQNDGQETGLGKGGLRPRDLTNVVP